MQQGFKTWINEAGMFDKVSNFFKGYKPVTDAEVMTAARNFVDYLKRKGIEWNKTDKTAVQNLKTLVKGFMIGHDEFEKHPKELDTEAVEDSLVDLTHSLNQVNKRQLTPELLGKFYIEGSRSNPQKLPMPNGSNPALFDLPRVNREFHARKPEPPVPGPDITKLNPYTHDPAQLSALKPVIDQFKRRANFTATPNEDILIGNLLKTLEQGNGPWESMLKRVYAIYRNNTKGTPETCAEFVEHLIHWYHFQNHKAIQAEAEKIDKALATQNPIPNPPPPPPPQPNPQPGSKDQELDNFFKSNFIPKWIMVKDDPRAKTLDKNMIRDLKTNIRVNLADWQNATNQAKVEITRFINTNLKHQSRRFLGLTIP